METGKQAMVAVVTSYIRVFDRIHGENKLNRVGLAERLDVTPQYVSKLLSGSVNFSFKSVAELETKLGVQFLDIVEPAI